MDRDIERLLRSLDAYLQCKKGDEAESQHLRYRADLKAVVERTGRSPELLDRLVEVAYPRWLKANAKFPTIPPKA
jgi:hypothetical protein